jgi:L-amino acid N-acyltransferase YncA
VRRSLRGGGIGRRLNALAEAEARALGYRTLYLHASSDTPATIGFWKSQGYEAIGAFGFSTHFDKSLSE